MPFLGAFHEVIICSVFREDLVHSVMSGLTEMRTEATWKKSENYAEDLYQVVGIRTGTENLGKQRSVPRHLDEFIITSSTG